MVASLEELGLVARSDDPLDKRASLVRLSSEGQETINVIWNHRTLGLSSRLDTLTQAERASIEAALPALERMAREL